MNQNGESPGYAAVGGRIVLVAGSAFDTVEQAIQQCLQDEADGDPAAVLALAAARSDPAVHRARLARSGHPW